ncbi:unnamed protein product [Brachionus calyciflorus]|uniref:Uncharacterized protein n=1 Tax=Brachionus calyciflorus TaxID=104777 RepID=A0A813USF3_9BILA|nr:unnamed protein product [Brachionus calyciflorus]
MSLMIAECEEMLKAFRCQDLANLLAFAGQSKNGKKSDLYDRCITILRRGQPNIQFKIKEIHSRLAATTNCYSNLLNHPTSGSSTSNSPDPMATRFGGTAAAAAALNQHQVLAAAASLNAAFNPQSGFMYSGMSLATQNTTFPPTRAQGSNQTLIRVQFEKLGFYDFVAEVNSAIRLIGLNPNSRPLSYSFSFSLNTDQINEILNNRSLINGKFEHVKQVHLRFGFYESLTQKDNLPANLVVNVNGKPAQLPTPKPTSKPNADIIRPGRSIDITHLIRLAPNIANKVELNWTNLEANKTHCVGVYFFRKVSVQALVDLLKANKTIDGEQTKKMVREKLQISDSDFEIETNYYKVSLQCPLMKFRIQIPTRATTCKHVQCFDLESFLMMNEKKPTWLCPVCDQYSPYDTLIIDSLFQDILNKCSDCEEIQFNSDAEWSKIAKINEKANNKSNHTTNKISNHNESNENMNSSPVKSANSSKIETSIVDICENDSITTDEVMGKQEKVEVASEPDTAKKKEVFIDLTLDSDDDDPTPKQQQTSSVPQLKQSTSINQNQNLNESYNEHDTPLSPSVSIISLSSSESGSPEHTPQNDKTNKQTRPQNSSQNQSKTSRQADMTRNPVLTSPVSSIGSNGSNLAENLMNASPIINTPPASINNSESYNSRLARDISSPKRPLNQNPDTHLLPKQTPSLASVESIVNNTNKSASNYIQQQQQQQQQSKNTSNRPMNNQVPSSNSRSNTTQPVTGHINPNKPHGLINSNNKIQKPIASRPDYLTKEKAQLINEQVRSSRSPNLMDTETNTIYRYKDNSMGNKMAAQLARIDSELSHNSGRISNSGNTKMQKPMPNGSYSHLQSQNGAQPFFLNNKSIPNGNMNNLNGMNQMRPTVGTPNKMNSQINPNNMNYNSSASQRLHHNPYQIPQGQSLHQQQQQQSQQQQQYHSHHYT